MHRLVGAFLNSLNGKTSDTENFDQLRGLNDYNFGIGGPVLGIPKLRFWFSGQYTSNEKYSVYEFDDKVYLDRPYHQTHRHYIFH